MFNKPESVGILKKQFKKEKHFMALVRYCAEGDFQAMIDEYGHLLKGQGLSMINATNRLKEVLGFRTTSITCQFQEDEKKITKTIEARATKKNNKHTLRCHYAVPLGNQKGSDEKSVNRIGNVRDAFNSPFKPFVLNTTSIGQEGLDFHWYCHRVVHWNLPHNPIDIEQREGRVNRYKSFVVRKRVAQKYQYNIKCNIDETAPTWEALFKEADLQTKDNRKSDLIPYWHYPEGDAKIERFVPLMPMSKDVVKFSDALEILSLYRLAFGQPRQDELLNNLLKRKFSANEIKQINEALVINLSPLK